MQRDVVTCVGNLLIDNRVLKMGGCCCSSRKAHYQGTPVCYYYRSALDEQSALQTYNGRMTGLPAGIFVGLNTDTSTPDTYQPPPAPIPFSVLFGRPQSPLSTRGNQGGKFHAPDLSDESVPATNTVDDNCFATSDILDPICKAESKKLADILLASPIKPGTLVVEEEEECCPICLEEYDEENPKMVTNCEHNFHLSCILEWMERSDSCPVCDKEMIFEHTEE